MPHDEFYFQSALDTEPSDSAARRLLAEWLRERGDWRAAGYGWLARHHKRPLFNQMMWRWWTIGMAGTPSAILPELETGMDQFADQETSRTFSYRTRPEAELAVCRALKRSRMDEE